MKIPTHSGVVPVAVPPRESGACRACGGHRFVMLEWLEGNVAVRGCMNCQECNANAATEKIKKRDKQAAERGEGE